MGMKGYISRLKSFYHNFLKFIENDADTPELLQEFITFIQNNHFGENPDELRSMLHVIFKVSSQHKRNACFISKFQKVILNFETQIKQTFSNSDIFRIFRSDKLLLLFLFKQKIITIDETIALRLLEKHGQHFTNFFYPEIKPFLNVITKKSKICILNNSQVSDENFDKKRQEGENDSYICQLIRNDSLDEFISVFEEKKLEVSNPVPDSIFESNIFLTKNETTLIEYAAFFGSIRIFQYLSKKACVNELSLNLWNFAIHSKSIELIHFLKELGIEPEYSFEKCFIDAVKYHHNDIAHYILDNLLNEYEIDIHTEDYFSYYNFEFFPDNFTDDYLTIFEYACHYDYVTIVKILLKKQRIDINELLISESIQKIKNFFIKFKKKNSHLNKILNLLFKIKFSNLFV